MSLRAPMPSVTLSTGLLSLLLSAAVSVLAWVYASGELNMRVAALEKTTAPLAAGDLVKVQTDVAWIRERLEKAEADRHDAARLDSARGARR